MSSLLFGRHHNFSQGGFVFVFCFNKYTGQSCNVASVGHNCGSQVYTHLGNWLFDGRNFHLTFIVCYGWLWYLSNGLNKGTHHLSPGWLLNWITFEFSWRFTIGWTFFPSSGLPFFTVTITMFPHQQPEVSLAIPWPYFPEVIYRILAPVLSA